jgi:hypothetical protein
MAAEGRLGMIPFVRHWGELNDNEKWAWISYNTVPWFYQFYVSWQRADVPVHRVWYEEHFADQVLSAKKMLNFLEVPEPPDELIAKAFHHKNANFTQDRTEIPVPEFVHDVAYDMTSGWGTWTETLREDLLG